MKTEESASCFLPRAPRGILRRFFPHNSQRFHHWNQHGPTIAHDGDREPEPAVFLHHASHGEARATGLARASSRKRIHHLDTDILEVMGVARGHDEAVNERGGGNQAVLDRHGPACGPQVREQLGPAQTV